MQLDYRIREHCIQLFLGDFDIFALLDLGDIEGLDVVVDLVLGDVIFLHCFSCGVILDSFRFCNSLGYVHMLLGIEHFVLDLLLRDVPFVDEGVDG